jgi:hypothetical protein
MAYTVTAPLIIAADEQGHRHHLYQGTPVPDSITKDEVKRLAKEGFIAVVKVAPTDTVVPADTAAPQAK